MVYLDDAIELTNEEALKPIYKKLNDFVKALKKAQN